MNNSWIYQKIMKNLLTFALLWTTVCFAQEQPSYGTITLKGDNPYIIPIGQAFQDPGLNISNPDAVEVWLFSNDFDLSSPLQNLGDKLVRYEITEPQDGPTLETITRVVRPIQVAFKEGARSTFAIGETFKDPGIEVIHAAGNVAFDPDSVKFEGVGFDVLQPLEQFGERQVKCTLSLNSGQTIEAELKIFVKQAFEFTTFDIEKGYSGEPYAIDPAEFYVGPGTYENMRNKWPNNFHVSVTYDGLEDQPEEKGIYEVFIAVESPDYIGTVQGTLRITDKIPQNLEFIGLGNSLGRDTDSPFELEVKEGGSGNPIIYKIKMGNYPEIILNDNKITFNEEIGGRMLRDYAGAITITATQAGNEEYVAGEVSKEVELKTKLYFEPFDIELGLGQIPYEIDPAEFFLRINVSDDWENFKIKNDLEVVVTYNGSELPPVESGSYEVVIYAESERFVGQTKGVLSIVDKKSQFIEFSMPELIVKRDWQPYTQYKISAKGGASGNPVKYQIRTVSWGKTWDLNGDVIDFGLRDLNSNTWLGGYNGPAIIIATQEGNEEYASARALKEVAIKTELLFDQLDANVEYTGNPYSVELNQVWGGPLPYFIFATEDQAQVRVTYNGSENLPEDVGFYSVVITAESKYHYGEDSGIIRIYVNDPPEIELNGASELELEAGHDYLDLGVTITDDVDLDLTPTTSTSGIFQGFEWDLFNSPNSITTSSENYPNGTGFGFEGPSNAFDGDKNTKYLSRDGAPLWIKIESSFPNGVAHALQLTTANDSERRDPTHVRLEGSNDDVEYDLILDQSINLPAGRKIKLEIPVSATKGYSTYKVTFDSIKGPDYDGNNDDYIQIADVALLGKISGSSVLPGINVGAYSAIGEYKIKYLVKDSDGEVTFVERVVKIVDTTAPSIQLVGDLDLTIQAGQEFLEPGFTVVDSFEGNLVGNVTYEPELDVDVPGSYTIKYSGEDSSGNASSAERNLTITQTPFIRAATAEAYSLNRFRVDFFGHNMDSITAFQGTIRYAQNKLFLERDSGGNIIVESFTNLLSQNSFNQVADGAVRFAWDNNQEVGNTISETEPVKLFSLFFTLQIDPGQNAEIFIDSSSLPYRIAQGNVLININGERASIVSAKQWGNTSVGFSGLITTPGFDPIGKATVSFVGEQVVNSVVSDVNGEYVSQMDSLPELFIDVSYDETEGLTDGVDVADILYVRKHILGREEFQEVLQFVSADVNEDYNIDIGDILDLRRLILRKTNTYSSASTSIYRFLDHRAMTEFSSIPSLEDLDPFKGRTFNFTEGDILGVDFVGIKLGDVNFDWVPVNGIQTLSINKTEDLRDYFQMGDPVEDGKYVSFELKTVIDSTITGLQYDVTWDDEQFQFVGFSDSRLQGFVPEIHSHLKPGLLKVAWDDSFLRGQSLSPGDSVSKLVFERKSDSSFGSEFKIVKGMFVSLDGSKGYAKAVGSRYHPDGLSPVVGNGPIQYYSVGADKIKMEFSTEFNRTYAVESAQFISGGDWQVLELITGDGNPRLLEVELDDRRQQFFRIRQIPEEIQ